MTESNNQDQNDQEEAEVDEPAANPDQLKKEMAHVGSVEIDFSKPVDRYNNAYLKAYEAKHKNKHCVAIACDKRFTPRFDMSIHYQKIASPTLPLLLNQGVSRFSDGSPGPYCFIYEDTLGSPIYKSGDIIAPSWKADMVLEKIAHPIIDVLRDFHTRDMVHGNIRADNLYNGGKEDFKTVKLGDCLSLPASMAQPAVYETPERAMADPIGRGKGTIDDDLYSLGVIMAMHLRSYDPLKGKTDNQIINSKIVNGSYSALVGGNDRFSSGILELLRGLLIDDKKQRWSIDEVVAWLDGRRLSPKQTSKKKKAARAINFGDTSYYYQDTLAHNLVQNQAEAIKIIENNELSHWIERTLNDEEALERLNSAVKGASEGGTGVGYWDRLLPRVSIALSPHSPIRYKGISFLLDGLGDTMAEAFVQKRGLSTFSNLFGENILPYWISVCANLNMDVTRYSTQIDNCRNYMKQKGIQFGLERVLYYLNDSVHCLSPIIEEYQARTPVQYLESLNDYATKYSGALPQKIIDKHAACFLVTKEQRIIEPFVFDLSSEETFRHILGSTQALAAIQKYHPEAKAAPAVTQWLVSLMDPVILRFHNKKRQKKIRSELDAKKMSGRIQDILDIIEDPKRIRDDQLDFRVAYKEYQRLDHELKGLELKLKNPRHNAEKSGREWAATISGIVSALVILGFIAINFGSQTPF
jgi:hypothetical protein